MSHRNAPLTPAGGLRPARRGVEDDRQFEEGPALAVTGIGARYGIS
ncbi:hypothetical protein [Streptomyces sp. NPDC052721]